jgi:glutathione S-transferase
MEVKRQLDVLDQRLAQSPYLAGDEYSIADIAVWPWYGALAKGLLYEAGEFLQVQAYTHVQRWTDRIAERPAVMRRLLKAGARDGHRLPRAGLPAGVGGGRDVTPGAGSGR